MYNYGYDYGYADPNAGLGLLGGIFAMMGTLMLISTIISIIMIVSQWIIFKKAGKKGWEAIVPIYNFIVLLEITGLPMWYIALLFVPFANIYAMFKIYIELAHKFGKSTGFGVLSVFFGFVCLPILAFGKNNLYNGNVNQNVQTNNINTNNLNTNHNNNMVNNMNNSNLQQPFVYNQNINNNVNNEQVQNINNDMNYSMNSISQPENNQVPSFATQPVINQQPQIVEQPAMANTLYNAEPTIQQPMFEPANNMNTQINPIQESITQPEVNQVPSFAAQPVINQQPVLEQSLNNTMQPNPVPQLNVIPGMGEMPQPTMPNQNNNNQNM